MAVKDVSAAVGATKSGSKIAVARNKSVGSSLTGEIGVTKVEPELGNNDAEAAGTWTGMVTAESWIDYVTLNRKLKPLPGSETEPPKEEPDAMITKEKVPDSFIDRLKKRRPFQKLPPIDDDDDTCNVYSEYPKLRDNYLSNMCRWNYLVDLHEDVLRQHLNKGYAEVGVDFTDGVKKIFILPQH